MRRLLQGAAVAGAVLLATGVCWAFAVRDEDTSGGVTALLSLGTLLCVGALVGAVVVERRPGGLVVPDDQSLPWPYVPPALGLVGACALVGGAYASPPMALLGLVLLAVALVGLGLMLARPATAIDRPTVVAARRLRAFADEHGGGDGAGVAVEHVGRGASRLVVVGSDGAFGDVVVRGVERAERAAALTGLPLVDLAERETAGRVRTGGYEWRRMAGLQLGGRRAGSAR